VVSVSRSPVVRAVAAFLIGMAAIAVIIMLTGGREAFSWVLGAITMGSVSVTRFLKDRRAPS
jgi:hypothetical protein